METIRWKIVPAAAPDVLKACSKCGRNASFECTGRFRINAQQKKLDVWLIYRCRECKTTWNMELLSRVAPDRIPRRLYEKYLANDAQTAMRCAFDAQLLKRNGAAPDYGSAVCNAEGEDILKISEGKIMLELVPPYPLGLRAGRLLGARLGLSGSRMDALYRAGAVVSLSSEKGEREKLSGPVRLELDMARVHRALKGESP